MRTGQPYNPRKLYAYQVENEFRSIDTQLTVRLPCLLVNELLQEGSEQGLSVEEVIRQRVFLSLCAFPTPNGNDDGTQPLPQAQSPKKKSQRAERKKLNPGMRYDILKRDEFRCVLCGATADDDKLVVDHIIPISRGGKTEEGNLRTLCQTCNSGKGDKVE